MYIEPKDDPTRLVPELADIIPPEPNKAFDIKKVIQAIVDDGEFLEVQPEFARSMVTALPGWVVTRLALWQTIFVHGWCFGHRFFR